MADKTFGIKVSEEMYEKAKLVIESSGVSTKDWFAKAVALYEMNAIKQGSTEYTQDLNELEHHTTRIYELITNMMQRSIYLKDSAVKEVSDKLTEKEAVINEFQQQIVSFKEELKTKTLLHKQLEAEHKETIEKLKSMETTLENNQALIAEYKEKNDTLSGLLAKYQTFADENEELKRQHADEISTFTIQLSAAEQSLNATIQRLEETQTQLRSDKQKHEEALQLALERKEIERERALVALERDKQAQITSLNEQHNEQIRKLYDEIAELRKAREDDRIAFQKQLEDLKPKQK